MQRDFNIYSWKGLLLDMTVQNVCYFQKIDWVTHQKRLLKRRKALCALQRTFKKKSLWACKTWQNHVDLVFKAIALHFLFPQYAKLKRSVQTSGLVVPIFVLALRHSMNSFVLLYGLRQYSYTCDRPWTIRKREEHVKF